MSIKTKQHLVAITGIGMICPLGTNTPTCWENMLQGKNGIGRITKFDASECVTQVGGQLPAAYFELENKHTSKRLFKQTVQAARLIRLCAQEALTDSAEALANIDAHRCAVIIGTSGSSVRSPIDLGGPAEQKFKVVREMINSLPAWISIDNGLKGPSFTVSAACASGSYAIARAYDLIKWGVADVAVAGGVDTLLTKNSIKRGNFMKVLSEDNDPPEKAMRPFDRKRSGFVISDGGCAIVLESYEHATKRNARVYAWLIGYGSSSESYSLYAPAPYGEGMTRTIEMALQNASITKEKIGYINANGSATAVNDLCETAAIKKVFDKQAYEIPISATKSMVGHTTGASGVIECAATALTLNTRKISPTINYEQPDPLCDLNYVPNSMIEAPDLEAAISNSFGFGGHNCVLVLTRNP